MMDLLGERLEYALEQLAARGIESPRVVHTQPPRGGRDEGSVRVVRIAGDALLVARFPDEVRP